MTDKDRQNFVARARIIKAMAHPTRLIIIDELSRHRCCVRELTALIGDDISTISRHLTILREAGLVADKKLGLNVWYELRVPCIMNFFGCVEDVLKANTKQMKEACRK
jgi:DNA-binding transcriptional ArsR family regulator